VLGMTYQGAVEATPEMLTSMYQFLPENCYFNCTATSSAQLPVTTMAMIMGGAIRVGLEDNIYYSKGVLAKSNAQLVERSVRIARELNIEPATPDEARQTLGIVKR
jgi:3-keto-5-aminohexanoate cleavage enzyme